MPEFRKQSLFHRYLRMGLFSSLALPLVLLLLNHRCQLIVCPAGLGLLHLDRSWLRRYLAQSLLRYHHQLRICRKYYSLLGHHRWRCVWKLALQLCHWTWPNFDRQSHLLQRHRRLLRRLLFSIPLLWSYSNALDSACLCGTVWHVNDTYCASKACFRLQQLTVRSVGHRRIKRGRSYLWTTWFCQSQGTRRIDMSYWFSSLSQKHSLQSD